MFIAAKRVGSSLYQIRVTKQDSEKFVAATQILCFFIIFSYLSIYLDDYTVTVTVTVLLPNKPEILMINQK